MLSEYSLFDQRVAKLQSHYGNSNPSLSGSIQSGNKHTRNQSHDQVLSGSSQFCSYNQNPSTFKQLCCSLMERLTIALTCFDKLEKSNARWLTEATTLNALLRDEKQMKERFRQVNREQARILT